MSVLEKELADLGFTLEEVQESPSARVVVNMLNIQYLIKHDYKYDDNKQKRPKKLFNLPQ